MTHETIHKRAKVYGPPGTGKTTYLLNLLEQATEKYEPDRIGAVSLTNAAVEEMRDRVHKHTEVKPKHIRTIHSICFNLLGLNKNQVADKKIKEFNEAYPHWQILLDKKDDEDEHYIDIDPHFSPRANRQRFNKIQLLRHTMIPCHEWDQTLQSMYHDWKQWMAESGYVDFTEMLELVLDQERRPEIDILLVDEAQDISKLSINVLEMWARDCKSVVYVGDSDQAILKFAGAVPEAFINLDHTWTKVLDQSYRVPRKVHEYAMSIIRRAENREEISYKPTEVEGQIYGFNLPEPDLSLAGTHMILGRCNYHLNKWRTWLVNKKMAFHNPYRPGDKAWNPLNTRVWRAAKSYMELRDGLEVRIREFRNMVETMSSRGNLVVGVKTHLDELLVVEDTEDFQGYDIFGAIGLGIFTDELVSFKKPIGELFKLKGQSGELLLRTEDVMAKPRVIIGTIHSVKGGECDHVWIDRGTSYACMRGCALDREAFWDEMRVSYVGVTRGRDSVGLLSGEMELEGGW